MWKVWKTIEEEEITDVRDESIIDDEPLWEVPDI
jgi:hypothetical protein